VTKPVASEIFEMFEKNKYLPIRINTVFAIGNPTSSCCRGPFSVVYLTTLAVPNYVASNGRITDELESI
jgi:hypothetical protein